VFGLLLACTRPEPRLSLAYIWPGTLFFKSRKLLRRYHPHDSKSINSSVVFNGHVAVFDT
ncbi:transmembrane protein 251, partial [Biomphalaria pfeifferi]